MGMAPRERRSLYAGRGLAKRREQGGLVGSGRDADFPAAAVAESACDAVRQGDHPCVGEWPERPEGAGGPRRMKQNGVERPGRRPAGLHRLIDGQSPRLDPACQQHRQIARRLQGAGRQHLSRLRRLGDQQRRQIGQGAVGGANAAEPVRPRGVGGRIADGEDRQGPLAAQAGENLDAVPAGEGQGGDASQLNRRGEGADFQQRRDDRLEAERCQPFGGARRARFGAGDPDSPDRRQGSVL